MCVPPRVADILHGFGWRDCRRVVAASYRPLVSQCTTAVDAEWLAELGPMFFSVRESFESRLAKRKKEREDQRTMEAEMEAKRQAEIAADVAKKEADKKARESAPTPRHWQRATTPKTQLSSSGKTPVRRTPLGL